jgi:hypothetical protein
LPASGIFPSLRSGQVSLDEAEHFTAQSRSQRRYAPMVFGIIPECRSVSLRNERSASPESPVCGVTTEFAWSFWTDVRNCVLDTDVESVQIDGPFVAGARGFTNSKSSGRVEWRIAEAQNGRAVIDFPLPGAVGRFIWIFEDTGGGTRITQRCSLGGEQADSLAKAVGPNLEAGIPAGLRKLCQAMENAARSH